MSKCAKCFVEHPGVGQSPDHPADLEWYNPLALFLLLGIGFTILSPVLILIAILGDK